MEPGETTILKQQPRPKEEPIVLMWMWVSILMNSVILSAVIIAVYCFSLNHFCEGNFEQADILDIEGYAVKLEKARTVAFISLVYSENIRAYIARSFDRPFWINFFGNKAMQKAIVLAQICLYIAVLVPGLSEKILLLRGIDWEDLSGGLSWNEKAGNGIGIWGWVVSFAGPVATLVLCELAKFITYWQNQAYQKKLRNQREAAEAKMVNVTVTPATLLQPKCEPVAAAP